MGDVNFKNKLTLREHSYGKERRENLQKEVLSDSTPFPKPVLYEDIDAEFKRWVSEDLFIPFEGKEVPTIALFTNQRFSEYMQSWENVDNNRNMEQNFKLITRENNPKPGTINGNSKNIPGEITFLMKRVLAEDEAGREYYIDYRMKQPFSVDLTYKVSLVTNKYELLNIFNVLINDKFKSIDAYIRPKGHFMSIKLNDITDESEYNISDRQFYSQSYNILVRAYIITEDSFIVEEKPKMKFYLSDSSLENKSYAEVEEGPKCVIINDYHYLPVKVNIVMEHCDTSLKFHMDSDLIITGITTDNIRNYKVRVNDKDINVNEFSSGAFKLYIGDEVFFYNVNRYKLLQKGLIVLNGYDDLVAVDEREEDIEKIISVEELDN